MAFSRDNQSAFISDYEGNIKMIRWKPNASSKKDFDCTEKPQKVGNRATFWICFTKDEKYLLVGSKELLRVLETTTRKGIKKFKLNDSVIGINLIIDNKKAIIAQDNGKLSIIGLETLKIKQIAKNITNGKNLYQIILI